MYKLLFWSSFQVGTAPLVIGMFFIGAVQLVFVGCSANTSVRSTRRCCGARR